jgi:hypothetical protein
MDGKTKKTATARLVLNIRNCSLEALKSFKEAFADFRIITANLVALINATFWGVVIAEVWRFSRIYALVLNKGINIHNWETYSIELSILACILLIIYLILRGSVDDLKKILRSGRLDIAITFLFGVWLSVSWGGFLVDWSRKFIDDFTFEQLLVISATPFALALLVIIRSVIKTKKIDSSLVVDLELEDPEDDLLGFSEKAKGFAERIFNGGAPDSFVFGVDAPWGIGKSTFMNFCRRHWELNYKDKTVVYHFSPLRYTDSGNLLEIFINGLIQTIQKDTFVPEVRPLISRYSRLLKEVNRFSIFGLNLPSFTNDYTVDDACDDLSAALKKFPKKIIVIVDDLDRIEFEEIRNILFVVRKSFVLPNISYVICYDTDNIGLLEADKPDLEKVSEFLEKFVNVKISLYLDREDLANYVSVNLEKALRTKLVDPLPVEQAIGGLLDIYKSATYHKYLPFIGDVRKLKRLINTVLMFEVQRTDFKNSDFDKRDLINLLLIYIHYPNVFRKIYDTETKGGRGFFSLVLPHEDGYPNDPNLPTRASFSDSDYKNSTYYTEYVEQLSKTGHERFLLDQVFNAKIRLEEINIDRVPEEARTSLACFNGGWTNGRNLEAYLELIVHLSKPETTKQHRFFTYWRDQIVQGKVTLKEVFNNKDFEYNKGEQVRESMWRVLVNGARQLNKKTSDQIIKQLLETIQEYSLLELRGFGIALGLRHEVDYFLTRLLNDAGWIDPVGGHSHNTPEHITEIAEWIFGKGRHAGEGVLEILSKQDRGILGIYDLMIFRLSCSADRGGNIFDLTRSLSQHSDKEAPYEGDTRLVAREEMREISQKVFHIFKARYIDTRSNFFKDVSTLDVKEFAGKYETYLRDEISAGKVEQSVVDKKIGELKTRIASLIIYQLTNKEINMGVGCGYYDPEGKEDRNTIHDLMNDYLFGVCFDLFDVSNAEFFFDYLFRNFASSLSMAKEDGQKYTPRINEFTKVLSRIKLAEYWKENRNAIKELRLEDKEKNILIGENIASYMEYIPLIYKVLDDDLEALEKENQSEELPIVESGESKEGVDVN